VYVIDKLLVGVHQDRDLNSAIIKVLPTGTKLEVVKRDGELALIKDPDGTSGWVDAAYLMKEAPAQVKVKTLSEENAALAAKLAAAGKPGDSNEDTDAAETRDKLTKENTELKRKLSAEKLKTGELQTKIGALESEVGNRPVTPADTVIADLESANAVLTRKLETAAQRSKQLELELDEQQGSPLPPVVVESFSTPVFAAFGIGLLLAFGGGLYFMDYLNRRRHGGFRV
ncbi:MAG: TIGR04211 family SH3 domain-containing protein, partial [Gammaproteobacteria bacterium]|nr:TIGR04211 family SH3 domain-containing protein [Gammaproteobacteria bacterium]